MVSGGQSLGTATLDLTVNDRGLTSGLRSSERDVQSWSSNVRGNYLAVTAAAAAVVASTAGVISVMGSAVSAASDLQETQSKSNAVFRESAGLITNWSESSATAFGLSRQAALGAASDFGNMFAQLGIGTTEAAGLSTQMVELAADFSSFHNADITDVLLAQSAAFRGEYDAVQRFVPVINAAAVEQRALEMGLADSTKELTQQDKALATHALLVEGAGDATGDFARTSDGLANQQRILRAQIEDVKATIGEALLPVVSDVVGGVSDWIERNETLIEQEVPAAIDEMVSAGADFLEVLGEIANFGPIRIAVDFVVGDLPGPEGFNLGGLVSSVTGQTAFRQAGELAEIWRNRISGGNLEEFRGGQRAAANAVTSTGGDPARLNDWMNRNSGFTSREDLLRAGRDAERQAAADRANRLIERSEAADRANELIRRFERDEAASAARRGGRGGGGGGGGLSALEEEALAATGKVREMADALVSRSGISLVEAVERSREALDLDAQRRIDVAQAEMDALAVMRKQELEAIEEEKRAREEAVAALEAFNDSFASLVQSMGQSSFFQNRTDHERAAQQFVDILKQTTQVNASMGLDANGNPIPGATPGTVIQTNYGPVTVVAEGNQQGQIAVLDSVVR